MADEGKSAPTYTPPKGAVLRRAPEPRTAKPKPDDYLAAAVRTAPREQLMLMLVDGAIRALDRAKARPEQAEALRSRARDIVAELMAGLRPEMGEVFGNVMRLYEFVFKRLAEPGDDPDARADEAARCLHGIREMWADALRVMNEQGRPAGLTEHQSHHFDARA
jgi:flagellin-specific chaperone FliS